MKCNDHAIKALKLDNDAKTASARDLQKTVQTLEAALKKHEKSSKGSGKTLADLQTRLQTAERLRVEAESATKKGLVEGRRREKALQEEVRKPMICSRLAIHGHAKTFCGRLTTSFATSCAVGRQ